MNRAFYLSNSLLMLNNSTYQFFDHPVAVSPAIITTIITTTTR